MIGLTFDDASNPKKIAAYLATFPERPTVRLICDEPGSGFDWRGMLDAVKIISQQANIMMMVCDSYYIKKISLTEMAARTKRVVDLFGPFIRTVEIGNEIGGDWLGPLSEVHAKVEVCRKMVPSHLNTAITWYYDGNDNGLALMKALGSHTWKADWHLVSWYPNWGVDAVPDWSAVFRVLKTLGGSLVGFGEFGEEPKKYLASQRAAMIRAQYALGYPGNFYWNAWDALRRNQTRVLAALRGDA